jgi:predicted RNA-binding protein (virulence factor B family)
MPDPSIGRRNTLRATSRHTAGMMLDGGDLGEILLPNRYVPTDLAPGGEVEIFLSLDSEDRLVATTETPLAMAGEFALLEVVAVTRVGAFLDWGMSKDLFLPYAEQIKPLEVGDRELVYIRVDSVSRRLMASAKLRKHVSETAPAGASGGMPVSFQLAEKSDLGFKAIVENRYWGLLRMEPGAKIPPRGVRCEGYIARVRDDGLVDLSLEAPGYGKVPDAVEHLATVLASAPRGFLPLHDKSPPEQVRAMLGMSKKVFKQAVGALYKAGRVRLGGDGVHLLSKH